MRAEGVPEPLEPLPPLFEGVGGLPSTQTQRTEFENDDFGTVVTEVTIVTTRKKYRVQEV